MIYVGIDVASKKHDCYIMSDKKTNIGNLVTVNNDFKGFNKLTKSIRNYMKASDDNNVRIGIESTGHYSHNILRYLVKEGFATMLINPLLTNMERKALSVRKTKTDTVDAKSICTFLMRNQEFKPYTIKSYHSLFIDEKVESILDTNNLGQKKNNLMIKTKNYKIMIA